jgi:hypothetical protein
VRRAIVAVGVVVALVAGCGGEEPDAVPSPTDRANVAPSLPAPTPAVGWSGAASFDMTGGVTARAELPLVVGTVALDLDELVVVWTDDTGENALAILWTGTEAPDLHVPLEGFLVNITTPRSLAYGSYSDYGGGCRATLERFDADGMAGTFKCEDLQLPDGQLPDARATGAFSVSRTR